MPMPMSATALLLASEFAGCVLRAWTVLLASVMLDMNFSKSFLPITPESTVGPPKLKKPFFVL